MAYNLVLSHIIHRNMYLISQSKVTTQNNLLSKLKSVILETLEHAGGVP